MKKNVILCLIIIVIFSMLSNVCYASWIDDGYSWAKNNGIMGNITRNRLLSEIPIDEFYSMLFKYFDTNPSSYYSSIKYKNDYYKADDYKTDNYILVTTDRELTKLVQKEWITNSEYKRGITLIDNAQNILDKNTKYFASNEIYNIEYYLKCMRYLLYEKIYDQDFKLTQRVAIPKNGEKFVEYRLIPYYGSMTREEFLVLMYKYSVAHEKTVSTAQAIGYYTKNGVLIGYNNSLMLTYKLNYAHFATFLSRM